MPEAPVVSVETLSPREQALKSKLFSKHLTFKKERNVYQALNSTAVVAETGNLDDFEKFVESL